MKILPVSDLHVDIPGNLGVADRIEQLVRSVEDNKPDVLVIAGDTVTDHSLFPILMLGIAGKVKIPVVAVMGNHDHYGWDDRYNHEAIDIAKNHPNFFFLDTDRIATIDGKTFIGSTLWFEHKPGDAPYFMRIRDWCDWNFYGWERIYSRAIVQKRRLVEMMEASPVDVVVTHHLPFYRSLDERYAGSRSDVFFLNDMTQAMRNVQHLPKLWIHGHTHTNKDYDMGGMRVVCNPSGYGDENPDFNPNFIVEI